MSLLAVVAIVAVRPWALPAEEPTELLDSFAALPQQALLPITGCNGATPCDAASVRNLKSVVQGLMYRLRTLHDISAEWRQRVKSDVRLQRDAVFDIKQEASKVCETKPLLAITPACNASPCGVSFESRWAGRGGGQGG